MIKRVFCGFYVIMSCIIFKFFFFFLMWTIFRVCWLCYSIVSVLFIFYFWLWACEILLPPQLGMKPVHTHHHHHQPCPLLLNPTLEGKVLTTRPPGKSIGLFERRFLKKKKIMFFIKGMCGHHLFIMLHLIELSSISRVLDGMLEHSETLFNFAIYPEVL